MSDVGARARVGAVSGASLAAALAAVSYLGWQLLGLPFAPFDLFDRLTRALPGSLVTLWIDSAVAVLRWMHAGSTAAAAKSAEQVMAIVVLCAGGAAIGAVAFVALRASDEPGTLPGAVLGGGLGAGTIVVESGLQRLGMTAHLDEVWVFATFLAWGVALGRLYDHWQRLAGLKPRTPHGQALERRRFLTRVAVLTVVPAAITAIAAAIVGRGRSAIGARWSDAHPLPNADASVQPVPGTRPELTPLEDHYRIDIDTRTPSIRAAEWRLSIGGLVERPIAFTLDDVKNEEPLDQFVTLACISNPLAGDLIGTTRWTGVSLERLLGHVGVHPDATHLKVRSTDGFFEVVALDLVRADPRVMVAYAWDGIPLLPEHGFPLRLYVPDVYGMKQPKWIESIEAVNRWEPGYWVQRGWDRDGRMAATSVIDTVRSSSAGGIAHAGGRRISRVEVSVDGGPWTDAHLRTPLSDTTWVIWRADLPSGEGTRTIAVRAVDGAGDTQLPPFHTVTRTISSRS